MIYSPLPLTRLTVILSGTLAFSIAFPIRANAVVVLCISVIFLALSITKGNLRTLGKYPNTPVAVLILLQLAVVSLGMLWSSDYRLGWGDLERSSFLLAGLVIVFHMQNSGVTFTYCLSAFTAGCMSLTLGGLFYVLAMMEQEQRNLVFQIGHIRFTDLLDIHPTYLSVYFILIFFFLVETLRAEGSKLRPLAKTGILALIVYAVGILILIRSSMGLLVFAMVLMLYIIVVLKRRAWLVAFVLFTVGLLVFLLDAQRVNTFFDTYGKNVSTALDQRLLVWRGTVEGIKNSPFFGAGTGGEQQLINSGYEKTGYQEGIGNSYNAHNQYLQFLARNGALELMCFLAYMIYLFRESLTKHTYTFLIFNMAVTLIMFAESFLSVQRGIVFFYFFSLAFTLLPYHSSPNGRMPDSIPNP